MLIDFSLSPYNFPSLHHSVTFASMEDEAEWKVEIVRTSRLRSSKSQALGGMGYASRLRVEALLGLRG